MYFSYSSSKHLSRNALKPGEFGLSSSQARI
jgi:hypothetical protein